jgi:hypothetical protein
LKKIQFINYKYIITSFKKTEYAVLPVIPILEKDVGHNITVLYVRHPEIKSFLYKAAWKVALLALPKYLNIGTVKQSVDVGTFQNFIHN